MIVEIGVSKMEKGKKNCMIAELGVSKIYIYISKIICQPDRQVPRQARHHTLAESYSEGATPVSYTHLTLPTKRIV